jgi:hypothetical protein
VTLIGNPTAAAEPISDQLLDTYDSWLFFERWTLSRERFPGDMRRHNFVPTAPGTMAFINDMDLGRSSAVNRAAVVLSTVGCPWREGQS